MRPERKITLLSRILEIRATVSIILINIVMFLRFQSVGVDEELVQSITVSSFNLFSKGNVVSLVTAGFLHQDVWHLGFNLAGIFIFGSIVEKRFKAVKTMVIYFGALILSMFISVVIYTFVMHQNVSIMGASGALMGLISCAMLADPFKITYEMLLPIPVMFKGWMFFYADIRGFLGGEIDGVSHLAHLLGFLSVGFFVYLLSKDDRKLLFKGLLINGVSFLVFLMLGKHIIK